MFLENGCTFYDRKIILFNIVAQDAQAVHHLEKFEKLKKSNTLRYMTNGGKNKNKIFPYFEPMAWFLASEVEDTPLQ